MPRELNPYIHIAIWKEALRRFLGWSHEGGAPSLFTFYSCDKENDQKQPGEESIHLA